MTAGELGPRHNGVEVEDDKLVRTCTVRYTLLQNVPAKDKEKYKGGPFKHIIVPVQRLVLIVPVEDQKNCRIPEITQKEVREAQAARDVEEGVIIVKKVNKQYS